MYELKKEIDALALRESMKTQDKKGNDIVYSGGPNTSNYWDYSLDMGMY